MPQDVLAATPAASAEERCHARCVWLVSGILWALDGAPTVKQALLRAREAHGLVQGDDISRLFERPPSHDTLRRVYAFYTEHRLPDMRGRTRGRQVDPFMAQLVHVAIKEALSTGKPLHKIKNPAARALSVKERLGHAVRTHPGLLGARPFPPNATLGGWAGRPTSELALRLGAYLIGVRSWRTFEAAVSKANKRFPITGLIQAE